MKKLVIIIIIIMLLITSTQPILADVDMAPQKITTYTGSVVVVGEFEIRGDLAKLDSSGGDYLHLSVDFVSNRTSNFIAQEYSTRFSFSYLTSDNLPFHSSNLEKDEFPVTKEYIIPLEGFSVVFIQYQINPHMTGSSHINMTFTAKIVQLPDTYFDMIEKGVQSSTTALTNEFSFEESKLVKFVDSTFVFIPQGIQPNTENNYSNYQVGLQFKIRVKSTEGGDTIRFWIGSQFDTARITGTGEYSMNITVWIAEFFEIRMSFYGGPMEFDLDPIGITFPDMRTLDFDGQFVGVIIVLFLMTLPFTMLSFKHKKVRERYMEDQTGFSTSTIETHLEESAGLSNME